MSVPDKCVSVIGCGNMGSKIARVLAGSRFTWAWNRNAARVDRLAPFGVHRAGSAGSAVAVSRTVLLVLADYEAAEAVLAEVPASAFEGTTFVNLITGTVTEATRFAQFINQRGGDYLEGSIWATPSMIGDPGTVIACSGRESVYLESRSVLRTLGGASCFLGAEVGLANVMEAGFPGAFCMAAHAAFAQLARTAADSGASWDAIAAAVEPAVDLLAKSLHESVARLSKGAHETDQASIDVYLAAALKYDQTLRDGRGNASSPFIGALISVLRKASGDGFGELGPSALGVDRAFRSQPNT
ncbi:NAD(P)-dependent oxidoreductase [Saccharopolyspora karakumensis]|uniref:NAD(P)-dependent oxidoreductase n=1 Tax=Saccharopolyspora karakumensis TaxID=2530386 RepID=A0A4R5BIA3_9PSEU|nr:NAD(P)-binding domain-containing protein [Saccharopolyspora karakumensis]TDD83452.1 NAD(P)-dependent oxidoreductase [Saccharopolyspora karakumensis]